MRSQHSRLPRAIDMKSISLILGVAGLVIVVGTTLANDSTSATPGAPTVKKDSARAISTRAAKEIAPNRVSPPSSPKPNLPIDAGRKQGTANISGSTATSGHKDGIINGTEIKRRP